MAAISFGTKEGYSKINVLSVSTLYCLPLSRMSTIKGRIQSENIQRKSCDVDTRDIAGVRKDPGLTGQHINLATNTACSYLPSTRASPRTKEALPQTALQVLDIFIRLLVASILSNKRGPCLCVTSETKPNQDK